jgi:hypothetical protein
LSDVDQFIQSPWAERAADLGWDSQALFGCHPARLCAGRIVGMHADWARFEINGKEQVDHRRPSPEPPPIEVDSSLELLRAVYRNPSLPLPTRMRAATAALPFEQPKLQATAVTHYDGDWADRLDRAIARSTEPMKVIEAKPVEPQVTPAQMNAPFATLRRRA